MTCIHPSQIDPSEFREFRDGFSEVVLKSNLGDITLATLTTDHCYLTDGMAMRQWLISKEFEYRIRSDCQTLNFQSLKNLLAGFTQTKTA